MGSQEKIAAFFLGGRMRLSVLRKIATNTATKFCVVICSTSAEFFRLIRTLHKLKA